MPTLLIAGIPDPISRRKRDYLPTVEGWEVKLVRPRSPGPVPNALKGWDDVLRVADEAEEDGTHIFVFHQWESDRATIEAMTLPRHRVVWLDVGSLQEYGTQSFTDMILEYATFEDEWRRVIRPSIDSPLLLPETSFTVRRGHGEFWERAARVTMSHDSIQMVEKRVRNFRQVHRNPNQGRWKDADDLIFGHLEYHAGFHMERGRRWKFTLLTPEGFHFNVQHERGQAFQMRVGNRRIPVANYANVDCHGSLRDQA